MTQAYWNGLTLEGSCIVEDDPWCRGITVEDISMQIDCREEFSDWLEEDGNPGTTLAARYVRKYGKLFPALKSWLKSRHQENFSEALEDAFLNPDY